MIVWGGYDERPAYTNTGGALQPGHRHLDADLDRRERPRRAQRPHGGVDGHAR